MSGAGFLISFMWFVGGIFRVYMRLIALAHPKTIAVTQLGIRMMCDSRDFVQRRVRHFGIFEHSLTFFTWRALRVGDVYLDIGANVGYFTLLAAHRVGPSGHVTSVEADPVTFRRLIENVELNGCGNVQALNVAATGEPCRVKIERTDLRNSGKNAIARDDAEGSVEGWTFEKIAGENISRLSFIKIDIEGAEAPILEDILRLSEHLSENLIIASEISDSSIHFIERFAREGFSVYAIVNVYSIDYYINRQCARRFPDYAAVNILPVK